jgi:acyl carrier protein
VAGVLEKIAETMPPLRGIIHAAGVLDDGVLLQQDWRRFEKVMAPKVDGSWNLHTLTRKEALDFFVLFSSSVSLLGLPGQGNHAAANAFMDVLAHHRRADGLPSLSINWGSWSEIGAAVERDVIGRLAAWGWGTITPQEGLQIFEAEFRKACAEPSAGPPQVGVLPIVWRTYVQQLGNDRTPAFLDEVAPSELSLQVQQRPAAERPDIMVDLAKAPVGQREGVLLAYLHARVALSLGLQEGQRIDRRQPLSELGLDSLMAVELRSALGAGLGLQRALPATLLFDYPTLETLTDYLAREVLGLDAGSDATVAPEGGAGDVDDVLAVIEKLSDDDVERAFAEKVGSSRSLGAEPKGDGVGNRR